MWHAFTVSLVLLTSICGVTAAAEPITISHRWGETTLPAPAQRVVSISYTGADYLLALGTVPIAYRTWYGGDETGLWPWASPLLGEARPPVLRGELDIEAIAAMKPDLIEAMWSGISKTQYEKLSRIAPVLPAGKGAGDFGMPWEDMTRALGNALGKSDEAHALIERITENALAIRSAHPNWQDATAVVAWPAGPGLYTGTDARARLLASFGFRTPKIVESLARGSFYFTLDPELSEPLDVDLLVWLDAGGGVSSARDLPLRDSLRAVQEGREIVADPELAAAMSYSSPLSLEFAQTKLIPLIEAAMDGDPETVVPGAHEAGLVR
ncbi:ABC transporter substrate-binding protein [Qingshengfaniella alkalisoli]|uniref:ABC transporter substrate-binding protein n=1 Tax=Qingshengfaniella alkalisoli TaxID=2599296 RepID=A0A5B8I7E0_9RHOB|nr:ABC transporter substrate-binding protein [Qingshengfaniella alkalisoli]QDY68476.1 ABC transporter substrate-binding protein [Qingshengfaniella alkalisoli]